MTYVVLGILGAVVAPVLGYLAAARKLSGRIATSEAASLWAESSAIRADYREQLMNANARIATIEVRLKEMEEHNGSLNSQNERLLHTVEVLETTIVTLRDRIAFLERENDRLHVELKEKGA